MDAACVLEGAPEVAASDGSKFRLSLDRFVALAGVVVDAAGWQPIEQRFDMLQGVPEVLAKTRIPEGGRRRLPMSGTRRLGESGGLIKEGKIGCEVGVHGLMSE
jgi:hypothetical protein